MASILKQRRDTEGNWEALNPVIPDGQLCFDITNNLFKIGDGINVYTALPVQSGTPGVGAYNEATGLSEGLMSISHHNKLDGIEEGAEVNALADWNSSSGDNKILNKPNIEYQAPIGSGNGKLVPALGTAGHFLKHDGSFGLPNYSPAVSISSIPTDSAINSAISSGWAFDNVKTAVPVNALFIDTVYDDTSIQTEVSANTAHSASTHAPSNAQANVAEVNNLTSAVTWVNVPDANITQASVTQHQAALSIAESQISDLGTYSTATGVSNNADVTSSNACNSPNVVQSDYTTGADVTANNACNSPNIEQSSVTGNAGGLSTTLVTSSGGTGLSSIGTAGQSLKVNAGATALEWGSGGLDNAGVIGKVLTGIDVSTTADVVATDTIVAAIGKLENRVATNDDKFSFPGLGTSSSTALAGNTALLQLGTSSSTALAGNTALLALGTSSSTALAGNTALLALGTSSSTALAGDTTTITTGQASAISANTLKNTNVVGDLSFTAVATKLQINTTNGAAISIPAATNTAWGAMSDDLVIALEANTAKPSFPAAVATGNILWKQVKVTLSEAQLTSMHSQAIQLIPAAGANTIIMVGDALALVDRDSSTAQGVASDLCIGYNGTTNYYESILYERRFMYNESGDRTWSLKADYSGEVGASLTAAVNVDVTAAFNVAITSGSLDSVTLYIQYYIIDNS